MGRRYLTASLCAALFLALVPVLGTPAAAAVPAVKPEVGVNVHLLWSDQTHAQRTEIIEKMGAAGLGWIRIDVAWASLQSDGPNAYSDWVFEYVERYSALAHERGMKVLATFWNTPAWANGGAGRHVSPDDPADLDRAIRHTATRLRASVDAWEFWNEPNLDSFYSGTPAQYVDMLKVAYPAFKASDPEANVVLGGTSYTDAAWLEKVYAAGAQPYFDILAIHPYMAPADLPPETDNGEMWTISAVGGVRKLMVARGDLLKPIWFTEFGWSSHANQSASCKEVYGSNRDTDPGDGVSCSSNATMGVTEAQQADYFVRAIEYVTSKNLLEGWGVTNMLWYNERNKDTGKIHEDNFGLLNRDLSPKPVYTHITSYLGGTAELPELPDLGEVSLLSDPGFESGTGGWRAKRAALRRSSRSLTGTSSLRVTPRGPKPLVSRGTQELAEVSTITGTGYVWSASRQTIRLILLDKRGSEIVQKTVVAVKIPTRRWTALPEVSLATGGASRIVVKVVNASPSPRRIWLDDMVLTSG